MTDRCDIAVVGAGLAGLVAATTAARHGCRVAVLDGRPAGGRARTTVRDGFRLNEGAHALYTAGPGARVLADLGVALAGSPPGRHYETWWDGRRQPLPVSALPMMRSGLLGLRSKAIAARMWGDVLDGTAAADAGGLTFGEWMQRRRLPADLVKLLCTYARTATYAADPAAWSAPAVIRQLALATKGVRYLDGGWQSIVDALKGHLDTVGALVRDTRPVSTVGRDGTDWIVETADGCVAARAIVLAAGSPSESARLLGRDPGWVERAGPAVEAACLDLGLRGIPDVHVLLSADEPLYLSVHAPPADLAPPGHALVQTLRYLVPGERLSADAARRQLDGHVARAGVSIDDVVVDRFLHRMTVAWGSPVAGRSRPAADDLGDDGPWVAGDWVGDELLADAAIVSGARAAALAVQRCLTTV